MSRVALGGRSTYGHKVGILVTDSKIPRIPGDPGHAETFAFPVVYGVLEGFPFQDLIDIRKDHVGIIVQKSLELQSHGVHLIAANCGLFAPFLQEMREVLSVPFIGSALDVVPFLQRFMPQESIVGIITGDSDILSNAHLEASGIDPTSVRIVGMESSNEFRKVVMQGQPQLDIDHMLRDVRAAASELVGSGIRALVIECTNLISFRAEIRQILGVPVYDVVSLIEYFMSGFFGCEFASRPVLRL